MLNIAINGFGRIGRIFFRQALKEPDFNIAAINDLGDAENLVYLLKYDTVYGRFDKEVKAKFFQEKEPAKLPWKDLAIDVVIEATGVFNSFEKAKAHLQAGAKKVIITAPAKDEEGVFNGKTILIGINNQEIKTFDLISNGSCTTNAVAPVMAVLSKNPGIAKAILNTVHAYTVSQALVDSSIKAKDFRRGRAAAENIVPSSTGAAECVARILKEFQGKFDGLALRVPVVCGSIADITFLARRKTTAREINEILRKSSQEPKMKGILETSAQPLVSSDIIGNENAAIVDLSFTKVVDNDLVKVLVWYDNEWGYCATLIKQLRQI